MKITRNQLRKMISTVINEGAGAEAAGVRTTGDVAELIGSLQKITNQVDAITKSSGQTDPDDPRYAPGGELFVGPMPGASVTPKEKADIAASVKDLSSSLAKLRATLDKEFKTN